MIHGSGYRLLVGAIAATVAAGGLFSLSRGTGHGPGRAVVTAVEPELAAAVAASGGVVAEVVARQGETVARDQVLVRFEAGALLEQRRSLAIALESARDLASIPQAAGALGADAHPRVIAAEEEYTRALAAFEQATGSARAAARANLERATAARVETRRRIGRSLATSISGMASTVSTLEARLQDLDRALAAREVRAPASGVVEILDLRAGDRIAPGAPAAVLRIPGEYFCEFTVQPATGLQPGAPLKTAVANGIAVEARIERITARTVPIALRDDHRIAEETTVRARFSSSAAIPAGTRATVELP